MTAATCVLFGDGAGAVVLERVSEGGFLGFELGADGSGGQRAVHTCRRLASARIGRVGGRAPALREDERARGLQVRDAVCSSISAEKVLHECDVAVGDVDVYVPHQANVRIIEHARKKLGIPEERTVVNVDRFGNTSSGSIPLALGDARGRRAIGSR